MASHAAGAAHNLEGRMIRCPRCGSDQTELAGYAIGAYSTSFKCYRCSPYGYGFHEEDVSPDQAAEMRADGDGSRVQSRANSEKLKGSR
jgi:DNA-directed RNA polymerase subunit RPC12/RpoP